MRKREIEKLLYHAVAEALGVETKESRKSGTKLVLERAAKRQTRSGEHRAAA